MPSKLPEQIRIATRQSKLAMWQAQYIHGRLQELYPHCSLAILAMTTRGDQILDRALSKIGGKGLFVKELEAALEEARADIAVHSLKDVPMLLPDGFALTIAGGREDPRDAFVSNRYRALGELPPGAVVGTSSLRRESQIRARFPHLAVEPLRGNVETRLRKLDEERYAAIILAAAGLKRLGLGARITALLPLGESTPAAGQGALGIEYLAARTDVAQWLAPLAEAENSACVLAERALSRRLAGSCEVPLGGHARIVAGRLHLQGFVAAPDGSRVVRSEISGDAADPEQVGVNLAEQLLAMGAGAILAALGAAA